MPLTLAQQVERINGMKRSIEELNENISVTLDTIQAEHSPYKIGDVVECKGDRFYHWTGKKVMVDSVAVKYSVDIFSMNPGVKVRIGGRGILANGKVGKIHVQWSEQLPMEVNNADS